MNWKLECALFDWEKGFELLGLGIANNTMGIGLEILVKNRLGNGLNKLWAANWDLYPPSLKTILNPCTNVSTSTKNVLFKYTLRNSERLKCVQYNF